MQSPTRHLITLFFLLLSVLHLKAQTTAFTYQGRLSDSAQPANGDYELQFRLADAPAAGSYVGPTLTVVPVTLSNGLFTVVLDFGATPFDGSARWLELGVRTNGAATAL